MKRLVAGIFLFLGGVFALPLAVLVPLLQNGSDGRVFLVPDVVEVIAEEPGRYYLWNEYETIYEGRSFRRSRHLPDGWQIVVADAAGDSLRLTTKTSISVSGGSGQSNSIGYVDVEQPGLLRIEVSGAGEARVFSFSRSFFQNYFLVIVGVLGASVLIALSGVGLSVWGVFLLVREEPKAG